MGCGNSIPSLEKEGASGKSVPLPTDYESNGEQRIGQPKLTAATSSEDAEHFHACCSKGNSGPNGNDEILAQSTTHSVAGLVGSEPMLSDHRALPEHFYLIFSLWPVVRPGVPEFLRMLSEKKRGGEIQSIYIYTANTALPWVRFIMLCIMKYYSIPTDTFDGIKHAPGGLKVVPDGAVLYDDHPENAIGNCVAVDPYTNEIPWEILGPILQKLPDHTEECCPLWKECGGLQKFIDRDQQYEDPPHNEASEETMLDLTREFVPHDEVLLDLDETLIAGARLSAYFNALNHFLMFRENTADQETK